MMNGSDEEAMKENEAAMTTTPSTMTSSIKGGMIMELSWIDDYLMNDIFLNRIMQYVIQPIILSRQQQSLSSSNDWIYNTLIFPSVRMIIQTSIHYYLFMSNNNTTTTNNSYQTPGMTLFNWYMKQQNPQKQQKQEHGIRRQQQLLSYYCLLRFGIPSCYRILQLYVNYVITKHDKNVLQERIIQQRRQLQYHSTSGHHQSFDSDDNEEEYDENMEVLSLKQQKHENQYQRCKRISQLVHHYIDNTLIPIIQFVSLILLWSGITNTNNISMLLLGLQYNSIPITPSTMTNGTSSNNNQPNMIHLHYAYRRWYYKYIYTSIQSIILASSLLSNNSSNNNQQYNYYSIIIQPIMNRFLCSTLYQSIIKRNYLRIMYYMKKNGYHVSSTLLFVWRYLLSSSSLLRQKVTASTSSLPSSVLLSSSSQKQKGGGPKQQHTKTTTSINQNNHDEHSNTNSSSNNKCPLCHTIPTISCQVYPCQHIYCYICLYNRASTTAATTTTTTNGDNSTIMNDYRVKPYYCDVCGEMIKSAKII